MLRETQRSTCRYSRVAKQAAHGQFGRKNVTQELNKPAPAISTGQAPKQAICFGWRLVTACGAAGLQSHDAVAAVHVEHFSRDAVGEITEEIHARFAEFAELDVSAET